MSGKRNGGHLSRDSQLSLKICIGCTKENFVRTLREKRTKLEGLQGRQSCNRHLFRIRDSKAFVSGTRRYEVVARSVVGGRNLSMTASQSRPNS
jgi:hypothetical protein